MELISKDNMDAMYNLMIKKDTASLSKEEKLKYCASLCQSLGLNPLTQPFEFIRLNGKETPYAKKDATDQLRRIYNVSLEVVKREHFQDVYLVEVKASLPTGRFDFATGIVSIKGLAADNLCNALMKAETKAKRRRLCQSVG